MRSAVQSCDPLRNLRHLRFSRVLFSYLPCHGEIWAQRKIPVDLHFIVRLRHKASGAALGLSCAVCFEQPAGVFAGCGAVCQAKILASLKIKNGIFLILTVECLTFKTDSPGKIWSYVFRKRLRGYVLTCFQWFTTFVLQNPKVSKNGDKRNGHISSSRKTV